MYSLLSAIRVDPVIDYQGRLSYYVQHRRETRHQDFLSHGILYSVAIEYCKIVYL